jgi:hypothetical protein
VGGEILKMIGRLLTVFAVLVLAGCAQRAAERAAPSLSFEGPLRSASVSASEKKLIRKSVAASLKDPKSAAFGNSYRAGISAEREKVVCGFVNGKRFVGMFAKPQKGATLFLPIRIAVTEDEQGAVRDYCRSNGIYLPR